MFTVAFDFDGVINDLPLKWTQWLSNYYDLSVEEENIKHYNMSLNFPSLSLNQILEPLTKADFWETVDVNKGIDFNKDFINFQNKIPDLRILIVTATSPETWGVKYEYCVKRLLPDFPTDNIILTSRKDLIRCDILIDDHIENLKETSAYKVLVDTSYNKNVEPYLYDSRCDIEDIQNYSIYKIYDKLKGENICPKELKLD